MGDFDDVSRFFSTFWLRWQVIVILSFIEITKAVRKFTARKMTFFIQDFFSKNLNRKLYFLCSVNASNGEKDLKVKKSKLVYISLHLRIFISEIESHMSSRL